MVKVCKLCGLTKEASEFYKHARTKDKLRGICKDCSNMKTQANYILHKVYYLMKGRQRNSTLKQEVLTHYGNGVLACVHCGFTDIRALSIDHIHGGESVHLRELGIWTEKRGGGGQALYRWLKEQGFPSGYQTLCFNCQWVKRAENNESN